MDDEQVHKIEKDIEALHEAISRLTIAVNALSGNLKSITKEAAHELRDDKEFVGPAWRSGADHMLDHWLTKSGRNIVKWLLSIALAAGLVLAGKLGVL